MNINRWGLVLAGCLTFLPLTFSAYAEEVVTVKNCETATKETGRYLICYDHGGVATSVAEATLAEARSRQKRLQRSTESTVFMWDRTAKKWI